MAISEHQVWSDLPISPGSVLEEEIEAKAKKSITPETALELEKALGMQAQVWVNLESVYRMSKAKNKERERLRVEMG